MSQSQEGIHCQCGRSIRLRDLVQMIMGVVDDMPIFLYVKYCCPSCHREEWLPVTARDLQVCLMGAEDSASEQSSYDQLGPIDIDEIIDFHEALENLTLADLAGLAEADPGIESSH